MSEELQIAIDGLRASSYRFGDTEVRYLQRVLKALAAKDKELAELREKLQDPNTVHVNILHGQIKLTKAQAIHIAGLPADVEEQLAELVERNDELEKRFREGCIQYTKGGCLCQDFAELRRDRELLDFADDLHNQWSFYDHNGYRRSYEGTLRQALRAAIRHSQTENGEGEG